MMKLIIITLIAVILLVHNSHHFFLISFIHSKRHFLSVIACDFLWLRRVDPLIHSTLARSLKHSLETVSYIISCVTLASASFKVSRSPQWLSYIWWGEKRIECNIEMIRWQAATIQFQWGHTAYAFLMIDYCGSHGSGIKLNAFYIQFIVMWHCAGHQRGTDWVVTRHCAAQSDDSTEEKSKEKWITPDDDWQVTSKRADEQWSSDWMNEQQLQLLLLDVVVFIDIEGDLSHTSGNKLQTCQQTNSMNE